MKKDMESISRRSFLAGGAAVLGAWVLLPATGHAKGNADPNRFILMADTHVCADRNAREHGCNPHETIHQAVKDILELAPRPAGVIVAGDCVYLHGLKPDYEALREFLEPLRKAGIPLLLAMGKRKLSLDLLKQAQVGKIAFGVQPTAPGVGPGTPSPAAPK